MKTLNAVDRLQAAGIITSDLAIPAQNITPGGKHGKSR